MIHVEIPFQFLFDLCYYQTQIISKPPSPSRHQTNQAPAHKGPKGSTQPLVQPPHAAHTSTPLSKETTKADLASHVLPTPSTLTGTAINNITDSIPIPTSIPAAKMSSLTIPDLDVQTDIPEGLEGADYSQVKPPNNQTPTANFWTFADPYLKDITEEDLRILREGVKVINLERE